MMQQMFSLKIDLLSVAAGSYDLLFSILRILFFYNYVAHFYLTLGNDFISLFVTKNRQSLSTFSMRIAKHEIDC